ncbi:hypothetical protein RLL21_01410, partial [Streptococcus pneumoniae]|nr:hypothetical protein [Streptococcus pneumoniae]
MGLFFYFLNSLYSLYKLQAVKGTARNGAIGIPTTPKKTKKRYSAENMILLAGSFFLGDVSERLISFTISATLSLTIFCSICSVSVVLVSIASVSVTYLLEMLSSIIS